MIPDLDTASTPAESLVAIALAGEGALSLCTLDPVSGCLAEVDRLVLPGATGRCRGVPMAANADGTRLYLAWRGEAFGLYSIAVDAAARRLTCLGTAALPASMCYLTLSADERHVLLSSNIGSVISVCPLDEAGCAGAPMLTQEAFKAHCIEPGPGGLAYATSLRGDFVQTYRGDGNEGLVSLSRIDMPAGSGPRHIRLSADGRRAYLLSEFQGLVTCLDVDAGTGALSVRQTLELLPGADTAKAAELRLGADEAYLYASERSTSQIFSFRLDASGEMLPLGPVKAPDCPTAFTLTAGGHHLVALGEQSGEAWTYRIGPDGRPEPINSARIGAVPSWAVAL